MKKEEKKKLPKVVKSGFLKLGKATIEVMVLDNGQSVVSELGMKTFINWIEGKEGEATEEQLKAFAKSIKGIE